MILAKANTQPRGILTIIHACQAKVGKPVVL